LENGELIDYKKEDIISIIMSLKKLIYIFVFLIVFAGGLVFNLNKTFSYTANPTHYNLAKEMIELYNLTYDPDINPRQTEMILKGSIDEDTAPRYVFHLYDPIYNRAPFGVVTAKIWAIDPDFQGDAIHTFANLLFNLFSKKEGEFEKHGDFSWPASIKYYTDGNLNKAYYGLGHILHLIADISVPAHSRNDHHITGDPLESWAGSINFSSDYNVNLAKNLYKDKYHPEEVYSLGQVFDELARYSNEYFFSKDSAPLTDLSKDYRNPLIIVEKEEDFGRISQRIYGWGPDEKGELFRLVRIQSDLMSGEKFYFIREDDTKLQTDYWTHLAPKAVQYGVGVIKLFLDEIGKDVAVSYQEYSSAHLPQIASIVSPLSNQSEVKGISTEREEFQPGEANQTNETDRTDKTDKTDGPDKQSGTVVSGPALAGDGWSAPTQNQAMETSSIPETPEEPQDTTPPDVSLDSLNYNYATSLLFVNWSSLEFPSVSFSVEYKQENEEWQSLLTDTIETQASLSISRDIVYSFRVKAKDLAGNQSEWQEKSTKINPGPSSISDFSVVYSNNIFITLQWRAPYGEDPSASLSYDIRYSENSITEENWDLAKPISAFAFSGEIPEAEDPGTTQTIDIAPLKFDSVYYFVIKTLEGTKISDISNVVDYSTGVLPTLMKSTWPVFQKNLQSTGFVPYSGPGFISSESVKIKWTAEIPNPIYVPFVMDTNGILYAGGEKGLYAIDSRNGELKWFYDTYNYERNWGGVSYSGVLDSDGTFYATSYGGTYLYALTPTGKLKWKFRIGGPNDGGSAPIIGSDGTIYVSGREQGYVYAINPDGTEKWKYPISGATVLSSPVMGSDETIYVAWRNFGFVGYVSAIDSDGNLRWQSESINPDTYTGLSIDANDNIYVGSNYYSTGYLRSLRPTDGALNWSFPLWGRVNVPANIDDNGNIYATNEGGNIYFLNSDGASSGAIYIGAEIYTPLVIDVDGIIYFVSKSNKKIIAFYPDGTEKWSYEFTEEITASPIIDENGILYVATNDGKIWAIGELVPH